MDTLHEMELLEREDIAETIILVEDDSANSELLQMILQSEAHYQVRAFASGEEALAHVEEIKALQPVLFLLDYFLLRMTALELYDCLHQVERLEHVPAMVLTANMLQEELREELNLRQIGIISKPFDLDDILKAIKDVLSSRLDQRQLT